MCIIKAGKNVAEAQAYYTTVYSTVQSNRGAQRKWYSAQRMDELEKIKNTDRIVMEVMVQGLQKIRCVGKLA